MALTRPKFGLSSSRTLLLSTAVFISLSGSGWIEARRCYWCGPLADQVHRSRRPTDCHADVPGDNVTDCDPGHEYCAIVATSPPYIESRYCVKLYQDECYPLYCSTTKTWKMTCPCRGDLCNGYGTAREHTAFRVLHKLVTKQQNTTRIKKRSALQTAKFANTNEDMLIFSHEMDTNDPSYDLLDKRDGNFLTIINIKAQNRSSVPNYFQVLNKTDIERDDSDLKTIQSEENDKIPLTTIDILKHDIIHGEPAHINGKPILISHYDRGTRYNRKRNLAIGSNTNTTINIMLTNQKNNEQQAETKTNNASSTVVRVMPQSHLIHNTKDNIMHINENKTQQSIDDTLLTNIEIVSNAESQNSTENNNKYSSDQSNYDINSNESKSNLEFTSIKDIENNVDTNILVLPTNLSDANIISNKDKRHTNIDIMQKNENNFDEELVDNIKTNIKVLTTNSTMLIEKKSDQINEMITYINVTESTNQTQDYIEQPESDSVSIDTITENNVLANKVCNHTSFLLDDVNIATIEPIANAEINSNITVQNIKIFKEDHTENSITVDENMTIQYVTKQYRYSDGKSETNIMQGSADDNDVLEKLNAHKHTTITPYEEPNDEVNNRSMNKSKSVVNINNLRTIENLELPINIKVTSTPTSFQENVNKAAEDSGTTIEPIKVKNMSNQMPTAEALQHTVGPTASAKPALSTVTTVTDVMSTTFENVHTTSRPKLHKNGAKKIRSPIFIVINCVVFLYI